MMRSVHLRWHDAAQTKDTGQLSIVTYAANTLGCIARIFTSYQDGGGIAMIRSFLIGQFITQAPGTNIRCLRLNLLVNVVADMWRLMLTSGCYVLQLWC